VGVLAHHIRGANRDRGLMEAHDYAGVAPAAPVPLGTELIPLLSLFSPLRSDCDRGAIALGSGGDAARQDHLVLSDARKMLDDLGQTSADFSDDLGLADLCASAPNWITAGFPTVASLATEFLPQACKLLV
jgi:hypothetical protein